MQTQDATAAADPNSTKIPRQTTKGAEREATRRQIIATAQEMFAARGYSGTTTRELAEAAGVAERTLFRHFTTKAALFETAMTEPWHSFVEGYAHEQPQQGSRNNVERSTFEETYTFYARLLDAMQQNHRLVLAVVAAQAFEDPDGNAFPGITRDFAETRAALDAAIQSRIGTSAQMGGAEGPGIKPIDASLMSGLILAVTLLKEWLLLSDELDDPDRLLDGLTQFTLYGLIGADGNRSELSKTININNRAGEVKQNPDSPGTPLRAVAASQNAPRRPQGLVGPRTVTTVRQVAIPAALLKQAGIDIGSEVYFDIDQDNQAVIRIWPADHIASAPQ